MGECTNDIVVIIHEMEILHAACYLAIVYQLPNFAYYSYWYLMILLDAYSMSRWLVYDYYTRNAWLPIMGLVHRNTFVVSIWNYAFVVSTWNYTFVVTHEIPSMLITCYMLVHVNDIVIYTYEIQQIHITFYSVSTDKWHVCY